MDYIVAIGMLCGAWAILRLMAAERQELTIKLQEIIATQAAAAATAAARAEAETAAKQMARPLPPHPSIEPLVRHPTQAGHRAQAVELFSVDAQPPQP